MKIKDTQTRQPKCVSIYYTRKGGKYIAWLSSSSWKGWNHHERERERERERKTLTELYVLRCCMKEKRWPSSRLMWPPLEHHRPPAHVSRNIFKEEEQENKNWSKRRSESIESKKKKIIKFNGYTKERPRREDQWSSAAAASTAGVRGGLITTKSRIPSYTHNTHREREREPKPSI